MSADPKDSTVETEDMDLETEDAENVAGGRAQANLKSRVAKAHVGKAHAARAKHLY